MVVAQAAEVILLAIAVLATLLSVVGVAVFHDVHDRLHYLAPATVIGAPAVAIAVVCQESFNTRGLKALLTAAVLVVFNPIVIHAIARAAKAAARGGEASRR